MLEILDSLGFLAYAFSGWRFILSPSYRKRTRARWSQQRQMETMQEIVGGLIGMAFTVLVPVLIVAVLR
jgi:hypothetical protein